MDIFIYGKPEPLIFLTVGLVTGAVLTVLGAAMLILNFREQLSRCTLCMDILSCLGILMAYIIPCVLVLLPIRFLTRVPSYIFRKLLHIVAFTCVSLMILAAQSWQAAALTSMLIAGVIYPHALLQSAAAAFFGTAAELLSPGEYDTVTLPAVIAAVLLLP